MTPEIHKEDLGKYVDDDKDAEKDNILSKAL